VDIAVEVKRLAEFCLVTLDRDGIDFMRPVVCVPSTKQFFVWMDQRGLVEPAGARAWAEAALSASAETTGADFLVAYQSSRTQFTVDAVVGGAVTSTTFDAPDTYI
jgi:hypothetical protein